jgi:hypothetical protein
LRAQLFGLLDLELSLDEVRRSVLQQSGYLAFSSAQLLLDWSRLVSVICADFLKGRHPIGAQF